jgi:hypothetical protein
VVFCIRDVCASDLQVNSFIVKPLFSAHSFVFWLVAVRTKVNRPLKTLSPYRAVNTLRLSYTNQSVNVVQ